MLQAKKCFLMWCIDISITQMLGCTENEHIHISNTLFNWMRHTMEGELPYMANMAKMHCLIIENSELWNDKYKHKPNSSGHDIDNFAIIFSFWYSTPRIPWKQLLQLRTLTIFTETPFLNYLIVAQWTTKLKFYRLADDVITWKRFSHYWPFMSGTSRFPS